jgi:recombination protein RecA
MGATAILRLRAEIEARFESPLTIRKRESELLSTGIPAIDQLTAGGIPRGALTEISGPESSGRTALLFALLTQSTRRGECCAWIDASGAFDPASAEQAGADLNRLLWVNCSTPNCSTPNCSTPNSGNSTEHALKSLDLILQAGGFGLIVLDLGDIPDKEVRRIPLASWFRLRHAAERTGAALIAVERQINARSCSALQLELRRKGPVWIGKLLRGLEIQAESHKHNRARTAEFTAVR